MPRGKLPFGRVKPPLIATASHPHDIPPHRYPGCELGALEIAPQALACRQLGIVQVSARVEPGQRAFRKVHGYTAVAGAWRRCQRAGANQFAFYQNLFDARLL
ncbi:hypothetical protein GCM10023306_11810 [Novosphingobium ginsenosidimutans]